MKKLIPILAILMFVAVSQAQTIVSYPYVGGGAEVVSVTGVATTGTNEVIAVCSNIYGPGMTFYASPSIGTWVVDVYGTLGGSYSGYVTIAHVVNPTQTTATVSCNAIDSSLMVYTLTNMNTSSPVDGIPTSAGTGSSGSIAPGSQTPSQTGDVCITGYANAYADTTTLSINGGFTKDQTFFADLGDGAVAGAAHLVATTSAVNPTWTGNGSYASASMVCYKVSPSAYITVTGPGSVTTIPNSHSTNITLNLAGTGTSWVNGTTTFTVSGVTGAAKVSQTVTSTTAGTLTITTGSGTGTLTVSDGTNTGTIAIAAPSIAISPTSGTTGTTPTLTLTGTNTLWAADITAGNFTTSNLFTESGGTGASLGTATVSSGTSATAVLTVGSAAATETITDASTEDGNLHGIVWNDLRPDHGHSGNGDRHCNGLRGELRGRRNLHLHSNTGNWFNSHQCDGLWRLRHHDLHRINARKCLYGDGNLHAQHLRFDGGD